jgi:alpha-beta hydrolase superfamily lysophospholipase
MSRPPDWFRDELAAVTSPPTPQDHDRCRIVGVPDTAGRDDITVRVRGTGELTDDARQALGHLVRAVVDQATTDQPEVPVLAAVGAALTEQAAAREILVRQAAQHAGVSPAAAVRILQGAADRVTVADLARIARWLGLDIVAIPASGPPRPDNPGQESP